MSRRRRLGQHYLIDQKIIGEVVAAAAIRNNERVLEIGAGRGALTCELVPICGALEIYEADRENYQILQSAVRESESVRLHLGDVFAATPDFDVLVTSLPYSESSNFIEWLSLRRYSRAIAVLQEEFAKKLLARPPGDDYRAISVISQASSEVRAVRTIARDAFDPPPRVRSTLVEIVFKSRLSVNQIHFARLLFSQRRRTLAAAARTLGIRLGSLCMFDRGKRVEQLLPSDVIRIADVADASCPIERNSA